MAIFVKCNKYSTRQHT